MRYIIILSLLMIGCSSEEKPKTDMVKFAMECKKLANKLKVDFIVEGNDERPGCVVGKKDEVYGGLSGFNFRSLEELRGAFSAVKLQEEIPLHDKLQACSRKCKDIRGAGESISCVRSCHKKAGYEWE